MHEVKWRVGSSLKPFKFMEAKVSKHKRSNSDPFQKKFEKYKLNDTFEASYCLKLKEMGQLKSGFVEAKKRQLPNTDVQNSLKQEISQLQERLQDQFVVRQALEKALSYRPFSFDTMNDKSIPKAAKELIKDIAVLELEVVHLEKYLLSLYRKTYNQENSSLSSMDGKLDGKLNTTSNAHKGMFPEVLGHDITSEKENVVTQSSLLMSPRNSPGNPATECNETWGTQKLLDSGIHRSHSSLTQQSVSGIGSSPPMKALAKAVDSYHSLPLSMLEQAHCDTSNVMSLAEHFGTHTFNHVPETPNWLSERMIKCISAIYCELADPPLINHDPSSPLSYTSSMDAFSSQGQEDMCSPQCGKFSSFNSHFDNPFHIGASMEFSGPYCTMAKVQWICRDSQKLRDIEHRLQKYRSLVHRLEKVNPRRMKHDQKLAFWINVHNALVMHAFLSYGIPQNNLKRMSLLLKAAYNIGGHTISVEMIQNIILGCRLPHPGQWLKLLFPSKTKFKVGDARRSYVIEHPEPRLYFALCSGCQSDPAVHIYTPKRVFQDLEAAKEEYIQSNFSLNKEQKIQLPKIVESFAKDSELCSAGLMEMIEHLMPDSLRKNIQRYQHKKFGKTIEWIPHNFTFRYLLSKELA